MLREGLAACPCPKITCKNYSKCALCLAHHTQKRSKPYCERVAVKGGKRKDPQ